MLFKWEIESSGAGFGHSNYELVMFLTKTYHLSTARRVKLELRNNERPTVFIHPDSLMMSEHNNVRTGPAYS